MRQMRPGIKLTTALLTGDVALDERLCRSFLYPPRIVQITPQCRGLEGVRALEVQTFPHGERVHAEDVPAVPPINEAAERQEAEAVVGERDRARVAEARQWIGERVMRRAFWDARGSSLRTGE